MSAQLAEKVQRALDRCKEFPESGMHQGMFVVRPDAYLALIELRNLAPDVVTALGNKR
jgi:hypothetical protein